MDILNIGVLAHVDAGKTTTVEQILYFSGNLRTPGKIEKGNTQTDWLSIEKKRGISVKSASITLEYKNCRINLIDTPGHNDFAGEVERALSVLDAAILIISASDGIQSQTEILWRALRELDIPVLFFLNKIDLIGCNPYFVLDQLRKEFTDEIIPLNRVVSDDPEKFLLAKNSFTEDELLLLCEHDESLAEQFLAEKILTIEEKEKAFFRVAKQKKIYPLVFGTASQGFGITELMDAVISCIPRPKTDESDSLSGIVYKIEHDRQMGKIAHIRLFSGTLKNRDIVEIEHVDQKPSQEKITQIRRVSGAKQIDTGILKAGDIAAVYGLSSIRTGDIIGQLQNRYHQPIAVPLFSVKITGVPEKRAELLKAISELSDEDPLLNYEWLADERELHIKIMGTIQIEVLSYLLLENYGLQVTFSKPTVIYKETPLESGIGFEAYTMPKPCWAVVRLEVSPLPRGSGIIFETAEIREEKLHTRYRHHIEKSVYETLKQGIYGWEVTDLKIRLIDGEHHIMHTHPMDFFLATPIALLRALDNAGTTLLEPLLYMEMQADESLSSRIIGEIIMMRGTFENPIMQKGKVTIQAQVPVSTSMDFPINFSALTSGKGILKARFAGYQQCAFELGSVTPRRGVDPLDRDRWILYKRGAL